MCQEKNYGSTNSVSVTYSSDQFVRWHTQRSQTTMTHIAYDLISTMSVIAHHLDHPSLNDIMHYKLDLPTPEPMHEKKDHWMTLRELEMVGLSLLQEARKPFTSTTKTNKYPGLKRALQHQHALMLRFLVRIPLRSRNLREMQLGRNLYKDEYGHWHLHFRGQELKIGTRNGKTNIYHVNLTTYCPDLLPHLEEFLTVYRSYIPQPSTTSYVFATRWGNPYQHYGIHNELKTMVLQYTGKRFYPHLIRTIWATEFISTTRDFTTAAHMLGDTVQMVIRRYQEILEKDHQDKASQFLTAALK